MKQDDVCLGFHISLKVAHEFRVLCAKRDESVSEGIRRLIASEVRRSEKRKKRSRTLEQKAKELRRLGYRFKTRVRDGEVCLQCLRPESEMNDGELDCVSIEICDDGPKREVAKCRMIETAWERVKKTRERTT